MSTTSTPPAPQTADELRDGLRFLRRILIVCFAAMGAVIATMAVLGFILGPRADVALIGTVMWGVVVILTMPFIYVRRMVLARLAQVEAS